MKFKRVVMKVVALSVAASMLTGCAQKETKKASESTEKINGNAANMSITERIKTKYAKEDSCDYEEPMYNLPEDYVFKFDNLSEKYFELDEYECVKVFSDSEMTREVNVKIEKDYDSFSSMTVKPGLLFNFNDHEGSYESDGTWGSYSKFWFVKYYDMETGEKYEKPKVTVFTIKRDLTAPTLKQSVQNDGYYRLDWSETEGADYYEVYRYLSDTEFAVLEFTTEGTSCNYNDFDMAKEHEEHWNETYGDTDIDTSQHWFMNTMLEPHEAFFIAAKSNDGKMSGMSNIEKVQDIAGQIPSIYSDDFETEYQGDYVLALPAYVDIQMLDESVSQYLIQYTGGQATMLLDGRIMVEPSIMNLPIEMMPIYLEGMEWDDFQAQKGKLREREEQLCTQSGMPEKNIDIPFLPDNDTETIEEETTEEGTAEEETTEEEVTKEVTTEGETTTEEETSGGNEEDIDTELEDTIFANTALSEWIALNMLNHSENISLAEFNEASDSEYLMDAVLEAYTQNPLIGIMDTVSYDYGTNSLLVEYVLSAEETKQMQDASLKKAAEISKDIIKHGMSDYEKEEAINHYICSNASYNEEILKLVNEDGTISEDAVTEFTSSFTPYGILVENYGVCESYAEAFLLIAKEAGLEAVIETGRLENVNHEWNRVKIENSWYTLDVTNNDNDNMPNCYFNIPDELSSQILVEDNDAFIDSYIKNYKSEGMKNEYYTINGLYTEDGEKASDMIAEQLKSGEKAAIRMDLNYGNSDIMEIVQKAITKAGLETVMYYSNAGVIAVTKDK